MLQTKIIDNSTYSLLREICQDQDFSLFALAGGTALALRLGHRESIDLDFFTTEVFDSIKLAKQLSNKYDVSDITTSNNSINCFILHKNKKIKVDFLRHSYYILAPMLHEENVRLLSIEDIAAMKLNAIANRGAKKDFFDIYSLLEQFQLKSMLKLFEQKYPLFNSFSVIKSLTFFDDAENEPDPISLFDLAWEEVKNRISIEVRGI